MDEFQKAVLEQLKTLTEGQKMLFEGQEKLFGGQKELFEGQKAIENRLDRIESQQDAMHERLIQNTRDIKGLKAYTERGFDTVIDMIESLDARKVDKIAK